MSLIALAALLFALGLYGVLSRRDLIGVLASVEVMLGSATLLLVGLAATAQTASSYRPVAGSIGSVGLIILVVAAAEAAVGLALLVAVSRKIGATRVDEITEVKG